MKNIAMLLGAGLLLILSGSCSGIRIKNHEEWKKYFDQQGVSGCFEMYDNNQETAHYYDIDRCGTRRTPAATFNIFTALVALDHDVAPTEQFSMAIDSAGTSLSLSEAFKQQSRPFFQQLAQMIGRKPMQYYLDTVHYGNAEIGPAIDQFWFSDTLKITADEQVGLLKRLYHQELPGFSERSQRIVRGMMLQKNGPDYRLYYTTGQKNYRDSSLVWLVGFIEAFKNVKNVTTKTMESIPHPYFFALNYTADDPTKDYRQTSITLMQQLLAANALGKYAPPKVRQHLSE